MTAACNVLPLGAASCRALLLRARGGPGYEAKPCRATHTHTGTHGLRWDTRNHNNAATHSHAHTLPAAAHEKHMTSVPSCRRSSELMAATAYPADSACLVWDTSSGRPARGG